MVLLRNLSTNQFSYIIHPKDVVPGAILYSWRDGIVDHLGETYLPKSQMISPGNSLLLKDIPVGTTVHCIGLVPGAKAQLCRAAGTSVYIY